MPVTVRNTDILFNDGTTQSTAAGAVTTTAVLNATAGASVGAVGTYANAAPTASITQNPGDTRAGSGLNYNMPFGSGPGSNIGVGTWRLMGGASGSHQGISVWLRIS